MNHLPPTPAADADAHAGADPALIEPLTGRLVRMMDEAPPDRFAARKYLPAGALWAALAPSEQAVFRAALERLVANGRVEVADLASFGAPVAGDGPPALPSDPALIGHLALDALGVRLRPALPEAAAGPAAASRALGAGNGLLAVLFLCIVIVGIALMASGMLSRPSVDAFADAPGDAAGSAGLSAPLLVECPEELETRLATGMRADVCAASGLTMLAGPSLSSQRLTTLEPGATLTVIGGPACPDAFVWWQVRAENDEEGWARESSADGDAYLCPQQ